MNRETKVGLLIGLSFIVLFGVILSGRAPDMPSTPEKTMVSQAPHLRNNNVQVIRGVDLPEAAPAPIMVDSGLTVDIDSATAESLAHADSHPADEMHQATTTEESAPTFTNATDEQDAQMRSSQVADLGEPNPDDVDAPVQTAADGVQMVEYTIKKGDTLVKIARTVCGDSSLETVDRIYKANRDKMPNKAMCVIGKTLQVPVVQKDRNTETLLQTGQFDEVAHHSTGKQQADPVIAPDDDNTRTTEVAKPAGKTNTKDGDRINPKNSIKGSPRDALALGGESATKDVDNTLPADHDADKAGATLAGALDQVTQEIIRSQESSDSDTDSVLTMRQQNLRHYQVQKGDTWYKMSARFLGDAKRWKELQALNDDIVTDATKLRTGVKIRVPGRHGQRSENVQ